MKAYICLFVYVVYLSIVFGVESGEQKKFSSYVDSEWPLWKERSYNYGLDIRHTPVPLFFDAPIMTNSTIMVRGQDSSSKRWGFHCFEAYADDDISRLTMLVNKHVELKKPVAEIYYFGSGYNHGAYNWVRIGSDVKGHSFLFDRDRAIFYGSLELENILTLAGISAAELDPKPFKADADKHSAASAKSVKYNALKNAKDGTLYYDKDRKMVVVKIDGKWNRVMVEPLDGYDLCSLTEEGEKPVAKVSLPDRPGIILLRKISGVPRWSGMAYKGGVYAELSKNESGCLRFEFLKDPKDNGNYLIYGEFLDERSLKSHLEPLHATTFNRQCKALGIKDKIYKFRVKGQGNASDGLIISVDFNIPSKETSVFLEMSEDLQKGSRAEDGVIEYQIWESVSEPYNLFLFERYKNRSAHKLHTEEEHFKRWNSACEQHGYKRSGIFYDIEEIE